MGAWNFPAASADAAPIPMTPSVIFFAAFVSEELWKPFVHDSPAFRPDFPAAPAAPSSSRFRVGPNPVVVGRISTKAVASGWVIASASGQIHDRTTLLLQPPATSEASAD